MRLCIRPRSACNYRTLPSELFFKVKKYRSSHTKVLSWSQAHGNEFPCSFSTASRSVSLLNRPLVCWVQLWGGGPVLGPERVSIYLLSRDLGDTEPHYLPFETSPLW